MKKEFLKGLSMLLAIVVFAFVTAVAANGQSSAKAANHVLAVIPFEFSVDYKTMPAGEYVLQTVATAGNGLLIQSVDGNSSTLRPSEAIERLHDRANARLVFHRYGQRYFLAEVWSGGDTAGRQLTKSRDEIDLEREESNSSRSEQARGSYEIIEVAAVKQSLAKLR